MEKKKSSPKTSKANSAASAQTIRIMYLEEMEDILDRLRSYEEKYGMSTVEFYARFMAGRMGDSRDFIKWASLFNLYQRVVAQQYKLLPQAA